MNVMKLDNVNDQITALKNAILQVHIEWDRELERSKQLDKEAELIKEALMLQDELFTLRGKFADKQAENQEKERALKELRYSLCIEL